MIIISFLQVKRFAKDLFWFIRFHALLLYLKLKVLKVSHNSKAIMCQEDPSNYRNKLRKPESLLLICE